VFSLCVFVVLYLVQACTAVEGSDTTPLIDALCWLPHFLLNHKGVEEISRRGAGYAEEYNLIFAALTRAIRVMRFNSDSDIFSHRGSEHTRSRF
jgi:hypothetical protein